MAPSQRNKAFAPNSPWWIHHWKHTLVFVMYVLWRIAQKYNRPFQAYSLAHPQDCHILLVQGYKPHQPFSITQTSNFAINTEQSYRFNVQLYRVPHTTINIDTQNILLAFQMAGITRWYTRFLIHVHHNAMYVFKHVYPGYRLYTYNITWIKYSRIKLQGKCHN